MNLDDIGKNMCKDIIGYDNINNLSLREVFYLFLKKYDDIVDDDKVLISTIYYLSKAGYDIISTHPLKLKRYK